MHISEKSLRNFIKCVLNESLNLEDSRSIQDTIRKLNNESQALKDELAAKGERAKTFFNFQSLVLRAQTTFLEALKSILKLWI